ncbi:MAG: hypothetical protein NTX11_01385 [Candidatus Saccharibacteria bacterium]|nr:hypothetical protein [Candidatus Saccharibacteria bacterium]
MSESLKDILTRRSDPEPPEIAKIKKFVLDRFNVQVAVAVARNQVVITASNAALAGSLRMHTVELRKILGPKTKLIIRIG